MRPDSQATFPVKQQLQKKYDIDRKVRKVFGDAKEAAPAQHEMDHEPPAIPGYAHV